MRCDMEQYRRMKESGVFGDDSEYELWFIENVIDGGGLEKKEYNRLWRRRERLRSRKSGKDARWSCGVRHGGGIPEEKQDEYRMRQAILGIRAILGD